MAKSTKSLPKRLYVVKFVGPIEINICMITLKCATGVKRRGSCTRPVIAFHPLLRVRVGLILKTHVHQVIEAFRVIKFKR